MHEDDLLVLAFKQGDENAIVALFQKYLPFLKNYIQLFYLPYLDREDRLQECHIVMYFALQNYDMTKNVTFFAFYKICLDRHFYKLIRYQTANKRKTEQTNHILEDYEVESFQGVGYAQSLNPEDIILVKESFEVGCQQLTAQEKCALTKRFLYNHEDIQKSHVYRGVHKMKQALRKKKSR